MDNETNLLKSQKVELLKKIPLLHKKDIVNTAISEFCAVAQTRMREADDFESKRQFLVEYVQKIVYRNDSFKLYGIVPVRVRAPDNSFESEEIGGVEFCINGKIDRVGLVKKLREYEQAVGSC